VKAAIIGSGNIGSEYGIAPRTLVLEAGARGMVGGQDNLLTDVARDLLATSPARATAA